MRRTWLALAACLALVLAGGGTAAASVAAPAGDGPPGFWWGTDSFNVSVPGKAPYSMPFLGGAYGGYIGMTGNWAYWLGCSGREHFLAYSTTNAAQAHTNFVTYHKGVGLGAYWFMGGPGVDPHYNGTQAEASAWGARQAARALADIGGGIDYPVVWMDIELPGIGPATDNGWNSVYTSPCSGVKKQNFVAVSLDRAAEVAPLQSMAAAAGAVVAVATGAVVAVAAGAIVAVGTGAIVAVGTTGAVVAVGVGEAHAVKSMLTAINTANIRIDRVFIFSNLLSLLKGWVMDITSSF